MDGRPFLEWKLRQLAALGVTDAVLLTGHGGDAIRDLLRDRARFGLRVESRDDGPEPLGTGGSIRACLDRLPPAFWVTYGDSLVEAPLEAVEAQLGSELLGAMTVLRNEDRWEPSNVAVEAGRVTRYEKGAPAGVCRWIDYGLLLLRAEAFQDEPGGAFDLSRVLERLVAARQLGAYEVTERFHDVGTVAAWRETDEWARATSLAARLDAATGRST